MNIKKSLLFIPIGVICLASCNAAVRYSPDRYRLSLDWDYANHNFNILQLSDLHMSTLTDREVHYEFMRETVKQAQSTVTDKIGNGEKIDLIVITGDVFTFADKNVARDVFSFLDSFKIPWTITFGNHDEQCYFSIEWLTSYLNGLNDKRTTDEGKSYCVFTDLQDDDVFGNANFVIDLDTIEKDKKVTKESIYIFDSNRYNYGEYAGYDYIHNDQIDWYDREVSYSFAEAKVVVPSLAFFHIPFPEFEAKYKIALEDDVKEVASQRVSFVTDKNLDVKRTRHEKDGATTGDPKINTHLYDHFVQNHTNGVFIGHNHTSSYIVHDINDNITLGFGIKSTDRIYADDDMLGGQVISLTKNGNGEFNIYGITHKYAK